MDCSPRPGRTRVDFYVLDTQRRYQPVLMDPDGRYHATVLPGFWLQAEWLLTEIPRSVLQALAHIVGPQKLLEVIGSEPRATHRPISPQEQDCADITDDSTCNRLSHCP